MRTTTTIWLAAVALAPLAAIGQTDAGAQADQRKEVERSEVRLQVESGPEGKVNVFSTGPEQPYVLGLDGWLAGDSRRISVDLAGVPVREALKRVFDAAKLDYVVDGELPADASITLSAKNVSFSTVLDLVTQSAGVGWRRQVSKGKTVYRVGKGLAARTAGRWPGAASIVMQDPAELRNHVYEMLRSSGATDAAPLIYSMKRAEQRSTFTCPHCKGQVTVLREQQQPKCPKCGRTFQSDWQFCPVDGAKRPPTPGAWKYCPLCGKQVEPQ